MTETANRSEGCPTCGSDDPAWVRLECPDPFHTPSDKCGCGEPATPGITHRKGAPCYVTGSDSERGVGAQEAQQSSKYELAALANRYKREAEEAEERSAGDRQMRHDAEAALSDAKREAEEARAENEARLDDYRRLLHEERVALSDAREALAAAKWELEGRSFKRALEILEAATPENDNA